MFRRTGRRRRRCALAHRRHRRRRTARAEPSVRAPRTCVHDVRFSEVGEAQAIAYIPADPVAAIPGGNAGDGRTGTLPFDGAGTRDCLPSQLGRTTGTDARSNRQSHARAPRSRTAGVRSGGVRGAVGLAEYPVYDPQTGVARDPWVTEAAMCVRLVDVRITCGLHDDAQIAAVFIDPRAK